MDKTQRFHGRLRRGILLGVSLAGVLSWLGPNWLSAQESAAAYRIEIRELWRFEFADEFEAPPESASAWEDGTVWVVAQDGGTIWEVSADGKSGREVHSDVETAASYGRQRLAAIPDDGGMLFLGRHGVSLYRTRRDPGVVIDEVTRSTPHGFAAFEGGAYVVSYGQWQDDPYVNHAVHRYDAEGGHVASWHPALSYPAWGDSEWKAVIRMSGGPVAVTEAGDLLISDVVPFRITRYVDGLGDSAAVLVEDESVVSSSELERHLPVSRPGSWAGDGSYSTFVDEMRDGKIVNMVWVSERSLFGVRRHPEWVIVSAGGEVLARERNDYRLLSDAGADVYLAETRDGDLVKLEVSVEERLP